MVLTFADLRSIHKEAIQWTNIAFMAVCRVINGAATSLDVFQSFWTSMQNVTLLAVHYTESEIQEFVDDFVMKFVLLNLLVQKLTTNCTQVTQPSSQLLWLVWVTTDVTVLLRWTTVS